MGVTTSLHRRGRQHFQEWWGRTTAAITIVALLAVVLALTAVVRQREPDLTTPVGAPAAPSSSAPAAESRAPAAVATAPAVVEPLGVVRRAPLADRYPGALLDAPEGTLSAYQRAAAIINETADCHLDWMTLAAIARIESDHGRGPDKSHKVNAKGVVKPAFIGKPLNGKSGRGTVDDTDAGKVDHNKRWDAPVGPLGLMPSTWATVAVDADGDDARNPQDVDDASLAAAVVLCAGGRNLAKPKALRKALMSYHRTRGFAATVVQLSSLYADEMKSVPVFVPAPGVLPIPADLAVLCDCSRKAKKGVRLYLVHHKDAPAGPRPSGGGVKPPAEPATPVPGGSGNGSTPSEPPPDPVEPPPAVEPEPTPTEPTEQQPEPDPVPAPVTVEEPTADVAPAAEG